jgi:beta-lactamase regulating signal transducer with metallopeptidase domain
VSEIDAVAKGLLTWLGSLSLQAAVLVGLALLLAFAVRTASPRVHHLIWLVVLLRLAIPIDISSPLGLLTPRADSTALAVVPSGWLVESTERVAPAGTPAGPSSYATDDLERRHVQTSAWEGPALWLSALWIVGVIALLGVVLLRVHRARRLLGSASLADSSIRAEVANLSRRLAIEPPLVKIADPEMRLPSPAAFGLRQPTILLPEELTTRWTASEREPLLVHELAHLRRRDLWVNALQLVVQTLYFFHPLVWLANRSLRVVRELACDEEVARFYGSNSSRYARALLRAAGGGASQHSSALAVTLATPPSLLGRRVRHLLTRRPSSPLRQWVMLTTVLVGSLAIVALASARSNRPLPEVVIPTDNKEWVAFVQELEETPEARKHVEEILIERVSSGEGDPELLQRTLRTLRIPLLPFFGDHELRGAWQERLERLPYDLPTIRAAAAFYMPEDRGRARSLLRQGWEIEPASAYWPVELAQLESLDRTMLYGDERIEASKRALSFLETARPLMTEAQLYSRLTRFARAAYGAGELAEARRYAEQLLAEAERRGEGWNYGNAVHHGHTVLGLLALAEGDREEAARRLLLSGDTPGSPQLNSFGPSFKLAEELLDLGEREAVLRYLEKCAVFWSSSRGRLESWAAAAAAGGPPPFRDRHY